jgi:hypothetical protein
MQPESQEGPDESGTGARKAEGKIRTMRPKAEPLAPPASEVLIPPALKASASRGSLEITTQMSFPSRRNLSQRMYHGHLPQRNQQSSSLRE